MPKKNSSSRLFNRRKDLFFLAVISCFGIVGAIILSMAKAASFATSLEPELASTKIGAVSIADSAASNGGAIKFGPAGTETNPNLIFADEFDGATLTENSH